MHRPTPFVLVLLGASAASLTAQSPLFQPVAEVPAEVQAWYHATQATDPTLVRARFVTVDTRQFVAGKTTELDLLGARHRVRWTQPRQQLGHLVLTGTPAHPTMRSRSCTLVARDGVVAMSLDDGKRTWSLGHTGHGRIHLLRELDVSRSHARCGCRPMASVERRTSPPPSQGQGVNPAYVDIAGFYTPRAKTNQGGAKAMAAELALRTANANIANAAGKVPWRFRLVHTAETNYTASGRGNELQDFTGTTDGKMDEVHKARTLWGADLMILITDPTSSFICGAANGMRTLSVTFRDRAFSFTWRRCLTRHTMTHEMGHNAGLHHGGRYFGGVFAYSYGFQTADSKYRTIMYVGIGARVNLWSSPNTKYQTYTMGTAAREDSARSLTQAGATLAAFYPTKVPETFARGGGVAGTGGKPRLSVTGTIDTASTLRLNIDNTLASAPGVLVVGQRRVDLKLFGGVLVPSADIVLGVTGNGGSLSLSAAALKSLPAKTKLFVQAGFQDRTAPAGIAMSDALEVVRP